MIDIGKFIDLTGHRFGRLTVITRINDYVLPSGAKMPQWLCSCDCGTKDKIVRGDHLRSGNVQSCGCLLKEKLRECWYEIGKSRKTSNTYNLSGEYGTGYTSKEEEFYFDLEDYDKIKDYCWFISDDGYVLSRDADNNINIRMHKLLLPTNKVIDHINGKRNDNRKCNLREVTYSQNNMNKEINSNNTSGVTGVSWLKSRNKWMAQIQINKKHIYLGLFNAFEDAVSARKMAEEKYFGEYSYNNSRGKV